MKEVKTSNKLLKRSLLIILILSLLFSMFTLSPYATDIDDNENEIDEVEITIEDDDEIELDIPLKPIYSDDRVIIKLADNEITKSISYQCEYINDVDLLTESSGYDNTEISDAIKSTNEMKTKLDFGIEFSKMRLLNPLMNDDGRLRITESKNNMFAIMIKNITVEEAIEILNKNPNIEFAEPNYFFEPCITPNDSLYNSLYALQDVHPQDGMKGKINAPAAWNITTGSKDVVVGVMDTGIDRNHPNLINKL